MFSTKCLKQGNLVDHKTHPPLIPQTKSIGFYVTLDIAKGGGTNLGNYLNIS